MKAIISQLCDGANAGIRKRASQCMGAFAVILNQKQLQQMISLLLERINRRGADKAEAVIQV